MLSWLKVRRYWGRPPSRRYRDQINNRQAKVGGYSLDRYQSSRIAEIGLGGLGLPVAHGVVRKGIRYLDTYDADVVDWSNLTRQYYSVQDVGQQKVYAGAKQLAAAALFSLTVTAYPFRYQERFDPAIPPKPKVRPDLFICCVDNSNTRRAVSAYGQAHTIPVIHCAVSRDANGLYVFIEEPGQACFLCAFPEFASDNSYPCNLPGINDVLSVTAGHILFACDTIIGTRHREWNLRKCWLDGGLPDFTQQIEPRPGCEFCAGTAQPETIPLQAA